MTGLLALAWAGIAVGALRACRPIPARVASLSTTADAAVVASTAPSDAAGTHLRRATVAVGATLLRAAGRTVGDDTAARVGAATVAAVAVLPLVPLAAPVVAGVVWALPGVRATRVESRRRAAVVDALPEATDLLVLAVDAGCSVPQALEAVARWGDGPLADELAAACAEFRLGRRLGDALDDLPRRCGEGVRPLTAALVASDRYGAPLAVGLARLADDVRAQRRRRAEVAARRVPVRLLFPLVCCTLPAVGLLTVVPLLAGAARSLQL